eukprot:TRINITY_DN1331_c0_g2_i1.p1 TRINITY_DN1331_c0_g2~~TRINITY_DN1331_c0_g2_i1.p1  ORF type:complete len:436 (-),score=78.54 TRINITY_DN1331_c0_g2_i1:1021-2328(-)
MCYPELVKAFTKHLHHLAQRECEAFASGRLDHLLLDLVAPNERAGKVTELQTENVRQTLETRTISWIEGITIEQIPVAPHTKPLYQLAKVQDNLIASTSQDNQLVLTNIETKTSKSIIKDIDFSCSSTIDDYVITGARDSVLIWQYANESGEETLKEVLREDFEGYGYCRSAEKINFGADKGLHILFGFHHGHIVVYNMVERKVVFTKKFPYASPRFDVFLSTGTTDEVYFACAWYSQKFATLHCVNYAKKQIREIEKIEESFIVNKVKCVAIRGKRLIVYVGERNLVIWSVDEKKKVFKKSIGDMEFCSSLNVFGFNQDNLLILTFFNREVRLFVYFSEPNKLQQIEQIKDERKLYGNFTNNYSLILGQVKSNRVEMYAVKHQDKNYLAFTKIGFTIREQDSVRLIIHKNCSYSQIRYTLVPVKFHALLFFQTI